jgi:hypothetical protein
VTVAGGLVPQPPAPTVEERSAQTRGTRG